MIRREDAVEILDRLHRAQNELYSGGQDAAVRELLTDDVSWTVPGRNRIAGSYHGLEEVLAYFARRRDLAEQSFRMTRVDVLVGERERVAALTDGSAIIAGELREWSTVGLYEVRAAMIAACWLLPLDPEQFDRIWSG